MVLLAKTNKEVKDDQVGRIVELAEKLNKGKWYKEGNIKKMSSVDRELLLESLEAEYQFLEDIGGDCEILPEEI